ncbi:hypothetical protein L7F22_057269 [Adiantum nelumboides]|nr:hypothetical protein [Adiantum nelumboides]
MNKVKKKADSAINVINRQLVDKIKTLELECSTMRTKIEIQDNIIHGLKVQVEQCNNLRAECNTMRSKIEIQDTSIDGLKRQMEQCNSLRSRIELHPDGVDGLKCKIEECKKQDEVIVELQAKMSELNKSYEPEDGKIHPNLTEEINKIKEHMQMRKESKTCRALVNTFEARSLMHIFFSQRSTSKVLGATTLGSTVRTIKNVAVVGCGLMGSGIATTFVAHNIPVLLKDISSRILGNGLKMIKENLEGLVKKGKMTEVQAWDALARVKTTESYKDFESIDLVVESVHEDLSLKQQIFHELESVCSSHCILASNTSALEITTIGAILSHQDRIIGAHFFRFGLDNLFLEFAFVHLRLSIPIRALARNLGETLEVNV